MGQSQFTGLRRDFLPDVEWAAHEDPPTPNKGDSYDIPVGVWLCSCGKRGCRPAGRREVARWWEAMREAGASEARIRAWRP